MVRMALAGLVLCGLLVQPVQAQMHPLNGATTVTARGAEVRATLRLALGSRAQVRRDRQPIRLELMAGPNMRVADGAPIGRTAVLGGDGVRFSFSPGHSAEVALAGVPVFTRYANARVAAAENAEQGGGVNGWAIAGGAVLIGLGVAFLALEDAIDCNENGDYVCE
ncbi:hypothetical protein GV829_11450 [Sphingomonas lacunae]|uniref:Uncharacterized protein n=1 Tax=Sphingomonas lacunae TaxID=2698828 RepID=A0A6M4AX72_9SPHN|nr:hypothetical protein [Sphingomonas lacunae]QJQ32980.1 hypothetical protein GV829_11450 [Sphingomonas lacunae]